MHLNELKLTKVVEDSRNSSVFNFGSAISTRRHGRPLIGTRSVVGRQPNMHSWFKQPDQSLESDFVETGEQDSILTLFCWGFRHEFVMYNNKSFHLQ